MTKIFYLILCCLISTTLAFGQLGLYNFNGNTCATTTPASSVAANVTFGTFSRTGVICQNVPTNDVFNSISWSTSAGIDASKYVSFTVSAATGYSLTLSKVDFKTLRSGQGPQNIRIEYNINGSTAFNDYTFLTTNTGINNLAWTFPSPITTTNGGSVTFRIYGWRAISSTAILRFDDVSVTGIVNSLAVTTTVAKVSSGVALNPLFAGTTERAILGFSLTTTNGNTNFTAVDIPLSSSPTGKFTNFRLFSSLDDDFSTAGDNTDLVATAVIAGNTIQFSAFSQFVSTAARYFFVVADVDPSVDTETTSIQPSISESDITVSTGTVNATSFTGTSYLFQPLPPSIITDQSLIFFEQVEQGQVSNTQSLTVSGNNIASGLVITPPANFEISLGAGAFSSNSITLEPSEGTIPNTIINIRSAPSAPGFFQGSLSLQSGSLTEIVDLEGFGLAYEPTAQPNLFFTSTTGTSTVVNLSGGDGQKRFLVASLNSTLNEVPQDGTTYTVNSSFGLGSSLGGGTVVYAGEDNSVTVSGLGGGTTYYFFVFAYNDEDIEGALNYLITAPGTGSVTTTAAVYTWAGGSSGSWNESTNWTPNRNVTAINDILQFNNGLTITVSNVPTQTIGQLLISDNTTVALSAGASGNIITIQGGVGTDLSVPASSELLISSSNILKLQLATSVTGAVAGNLTFSDEAHEINVADANGLIFSSGATFTASSNFAGTPFGNNSTAVSGLNSVVFSSGSTYTANGGDNPFGAIAPASVVVFQNGSLYRHQMASPPSLNGRNYGNFEINFATGNYTMSGAGGFSVQNLTVTSANIAAFNVAGIVSISGNITAGEGSISFNPSSATTINLSKPSALDISGGATLLTFGTNTNVTVSSPDVTLTRNITIDGTWNNGVSVITGTGTVTINGTFRTANPNGFFGSSNTALATGISRIFGTTATVDFNGSGAQRINSGGYRNLTVSGSGRTITLSNSAPINIFLAFTPNNNTFITTGSTINLNGTTAQDVPGLNYDNLTLSGSGVKTLLGNINLTGTFTLSGTASFDADGPANDKVFTLVSSSTTSTARIAPLPVPANFTGNVVAQKYIPGIRAYRYLSSPINTTTFVGMSDDFPVTGFTGGTTGPKIIETSPSVYRYEETVAGVKNAGFVAYGTSMSSPMTNGIGYLTFIRSLADGAAPTFSPIIWDVTGPINKGDIDVPLSYTNSGSVIDDGWNLVGNPYPSQISWNDVYASSTGLSAQVAIRTVTGPSTYQFTYYTAPCINCNVSSNQAIWVQAIDQPTKVISFRESHKNSGAASFLRVASIENELKVILSNQQAVDSTTIRLNEQATQGYDAAFDAVKFENTLLNVSSLSTDGRRYDLAINSMPLANVEAFQIPLKVTKDSLSSPKMKFSFKGLETFGDLRVYLEDMYKGEFQRVESNTDYEFTVSADSASYGADRFRIVFSLSDLSAESTKSSLILYPNPSNDGSKVDYQLLNVANIREMDVHIVDMMGREFYAGAINKIEGTNYSGTLRLSNTLPKGVYIITMKNGSQHLQKKLVIN
jgi:hypothetical protein